MDKQTEINAEVQRALNYLAELILDLSWATPALQEKSGWNNLHQKLRDVIRHIDHLNSGS